MTRSISLVLPLKTGEEAKIVLCDKYEHRVNDTALVIMATDTPLGLTLEVNVLDTCWVLEYAENKRTAFWVYEGEGLQNIDLSSPITKRNTLNTFLSSSDETLGHNAERVMGKMLCGEPVVCEEEQRFLCRYQNHIEDSYDVDMCRIDSTLTKRMING